MGPSNKKPRPATTGVLIVDKPPGRTSMDAVSIVRRRAGGARTGHAGTLDPLATGVLVMVLGSATRSVSRFMDTEKRYLTTIDLSAFTETDDREGTREEVDVANPPGRDQIDAVLPNFTGLIQQRPPARSAVKLGGRRAYQRSRRGETLQLEPRPVLVHQLSVLHYRWPLLELDVRCAKGTYVRSLARDIGVSLGTGGHCAAIRRTMVGPFTIDEATELSAVPDPLTESELIPLDEALLRLE